MMAIFRFAIAAAAVLPIIIVPILVSYAPNFFIGSDDVSTVLIWSFIGIAMSHYGLLFSLFAAVEVYSLSNKYMFKLRSPDIAKQLRSISKKLSSFNSEPSVDISSQSFVHESFVALRAAKRMRNSEVKRIATEADTALTYLMQQAGLLGAPGLSAGQVNGFWEFFQKISELADEVKAQMEDARAI
jgi:hypothetical protein